MSKYFQPFAKTQKGRIRRDTRRAVIAQKFGALNDGIYSRELRD